MTVCVAAIFKSAYTKPDGSIEMGPAIAALSDRMITAGDVEYEPYQLKVSFVSKKTVILIAGDYPPHSEALRIVLPKFAFRPDAGPTDVAFSYGAAIQQIRHKAAEVRILAPLGLNTDTFLAQQKEMSEGFVASITQELQNFRGPDVEALVAGMDENDKAWIYQLDPEGLVHNFTDVGFAAIGSGAWHAKSSLMRAGYTSQFPFASAVGSVYSAKRAAEVAPGVGSGTDTYFIFRNGTEKFYEPWEKKLQSLYSDYEQERSALAAAKVKEFQEYITDAKNKPNFTETSGNPATGRDSETAGSGAAEGPQNAPEGTDEVQRKEP